MTNIFSNKPWFDSVKFLLDEHLPVNIEPSNTIFFDDYPYKVELEGNSIHKDILLHAEIDDFLNTELFYYNWRSSYNQNSRKIYFSYFNELKWFLALFKYYALHVEGPFNQEHFDTLCRNKYHRNDSIIRNKYYYNKYDFKIETSYIWSDKYTSAEDYLGIDSIVKANTSEYKWHTNINYKHYYNHLYVHSSEAELLLALLNLTYKKYISRTEKVILKSDLISEKNVLERKQ